MAVLEAASALRFAVVFLLAHTCLLLLLVWARHRAASVRIRRAGGIRAPVLAGNFLSASSLYYRAGKSLYDNRLPSWCSEALDGLPGGRHFAEFSLTGKKRVLITRDPEQIKAVLSTKFGSFGHGPQWRKLWQPFLGDDIFATDGRPWHKSRERMRPMFAKQRLRSLAIVDACTDKLLSKLPPSGAAVDLKDLFYRWALDTTTDFVLGENANSLDNPDHQVADAMSVAQQAQMFIFVLNPIAPLIPKGDYHRAIRKMEDFIEPMIACAVALSLRELAELSRPDMRYTFLHSLARSSRDRKTIRDEVMSVLLEGHDTTAATMSWAMYEIANYPDVWARLRREALDVVGPSGKPTYNSLRDLGYVRNVLDETLRLHPAVPMNMRQALETTIPGAPGEPHVVLLEGDTVTMHTLGMHARRDLYSPASDKFADPAVFSPERWDCWTPRPWTYAPFSGGPRTCLGRDFALVEMAFCLVHLAQRYERIEYRGDWSAQAMQTDIIGTPAPGVPVALYEPGASG